jgi:peptidoglycan/LPS O-acetylase OafA/YrhL
MADKFRSEIAGLRAIAVLSVVLFHLRVRWFDGGFVGVDVFFVISGYLISRNILADLQTGRFSLGRFYVRRTRRIYPALIATVIATYVAGALWCAPLMFLDIAKECTHALLSIANIQYWRESHHYFAPSSDELALLHFWSLSAEEQFYLVWPVFIALAHRRGRAYAAIAIAGLVSLGAAVLVARSDPSAAFFLTPFRIFEFAIGALVLWAERQLDRSTRASEAAAAAGVIAILASVALFRADLPHLEIALLVPCLGSAAVIWAGRAPRVSAVIANPVMIAIGAISYSLYLCHWPIIYFARFIFGDGADGPAATLVMLALMIAVATAMYLLVERRFIQPHDARPPLVRNAAVFAAVVLPLAALTHATFLSQGFAWRLPKGQAEREHLQDFPDARDMVAIDGPLRFELVGDSLATQYIAGLSPLAKRLSMKFDLLAGSGCPILYGVQLRHPRRAECMQVRDDALALLSKTSLPLIYIQKWSLYDDAMLDADGDPGGASAADRYAKLQWAIEQTFARLLASGRHILIVGEQVRAACAIDRKRLLQGPLPHRPPPPCAPTPRAAVEAANAPIDRMLAGFQARWPDQVRMFRPVDYFCGSECPVVKDGDWLYFNSTHFSVAGSRYMVDRSAPVFRDFLAR